MASTWTQLKRTFGIALPASAAFLALTGGMASAADILETCPDVTLDPSVQPMPGFPGYMDHAQAVTCTATYGGCFRFDGSDTLTELVQKGIDASNACLSYHNIGSGQGEKNISNAASGTTTIQGIAPMSRNFASGFGTGIPVTVTNVAALDAPVVSFSMLGSTLCQDVSPGYIPGQQDTAPVDNSIARILGGVNATAGTVSKGKTSECADPRRIAALDALASCQGVDQILHILRRDDKSGTQDTFREHLNFAYWCNGNSPGNINAPGSNLKNEDLDPIRRPCVGADGTKVQTRCTYYPTVQTCTAGSAAITVPGYGTVPCTQGLVVALSENDPGAKDITISIGRRVGLDLTYRTLGLAGLASNDPVNLKTQGATINTNTYEVDNIRLKAYMLARKLFIMGPVATPNANRNTEEGKFFTYISSNCGIQQITADAGFVLPQDGVCGNTPCSDLTGNPLACGPSDPGLGAAAQTIGYGELCSSSNPCVNTGAKCTVGAGLTCQDLSPKLSAGFACHVDGMCTGHCSGTDPATSICGT